MSVEQLRIDPDLRFAVRPPSALYVAEEWFRLVADRVLARSWHVVAGAADVAERESARPVTLLPGALDEPLLVTRDRKSRLHCLANSCTDGGEIVCAAAGPAKLLRCAPHGRSFRLDGELMDAPGFAGAIGFPSPSDSLVRLSAAVWGQVVFASLDPATPFEEMVRALRERSPEAGDAGSPWSPHFGSEEVEANWALWVEAALSILFATDSEIDLHGAGVASSATSRRAWLFPATFVEVLPQVCRVTSIEPVAAARTRVVHRTFLGGDQWEATGWTADPEDLTARQRGLRSRVHRPGRYAPGRDRAVHHFHRLLADALARA